ncbi:hypothetical protein MFIFM68171_10725 [Madurella fahalii]|uniref:DUF5672 domain-containing protein n=1 Tax=Madurella fahalii TaxID=1157608 RepID=A0ABQ0GS04_9PEZI
MAAFVKPLSNPSGGMAEKAAVTLIIGSWQKGKLLAQTCWGRTSRRVRLLSMTALFLVLTALLSRTTRIPVPSVSLQYRTQLALQSSKLNASKLALLIEDRPQPILAPLMLHFISVVPPDWKFRFMGSPRSLAHINQSVAIREQVARGKLDLAPIPANLSTGSQEAISGFLTTLWLYETLLAPAEWLLVFQTDSVLCANSRRSLNDFLQYDWVGAPWALNASFGGNGGLSLRRVSAVVDVLRNQARKPGSEPEDLWLTERLAHRPGARLANGTVGSQFSGEQYAGATVDVYGGEGRNRTAAGSGKAEEKGGAEDATYVEGLDDWRHGFYEPMGYHTGAGGSFLHSRIFGTPELRKHLWEYCPELKMTLKMDVAQYMPGDCNPRWKRDEEWFETEVIDGEEYPVLRGVVPW